MLLKAELALNFQQCSAFPSCSFFAEPGENPKLSSSELSGQDPVSISHPVCSAHRFEACSWEAFGSLSLFPSPPHWNPAFGIKNTTGYF